VNFRPIVAEFTLLKRAIFEAIRQKFDDDLHSSCWHFKMDRKITILILAIILVHLVEIIGEIRFSDLGV